MYQIKVIRDFSGAHFLREYKGKCESLHGHNWKVEVIAESKELDSLGMVLDFGELKKLIDKVLDDLDHKLLNELESFKDCNPSSENIAHYIYCRIKDKLSGSPVKLDQVRVWETDSSCATYKES